MSSTTSSASAPWLAGDPLERVTAYRLALQASSDALVDSRRLLTSPLAREVASQLYRAVGSIGANIAEGYGRRSGRDRARYFEYALGSARESLHWYIAAGLAIPSTTFEKQVNRLVRIRQLLLVSIPTEREREFGAMGASERPRRPDK